MRYELKMMLSSGIVRCAQIVNGVNTLRILFEELELDKLVYTRYALGIQLNSKSQTEMIKCRGETCVDSLNFNLSYSIDV